jgi:hypothetical protein
MTLICLEMEGRMGLGSFTFGFLKDLDVKDSDPTFKRGVRRSTRVCDISDILAISETLAKFTISPGECFAYWDWAKVTN